MGLETLCYVSHSRIGGDRSALGDILRASLRNNARDAITGALYFDERQFLQVLEGAPDALTDLAARIFADPRHERVTVIRRCAIAGRRFSGWAMKPVDGGRLAHLRSAFAHETLCAADAARLQRRLALLARLDAARFQAPA